MWKGIDVSDNQGVINWREVQQAGCQFAILRSIRRSGKADNQFEANLDGCRRCGIPISVYKYTYATSEAAAVEEAKQVIELLQRNNLNCMVWWDVEDRDNLFPLGKNKLTDCVLAAQKTIEAAGYRFGLYIGLYVYNEKWFDFTKFSCPLWVARYPSSTEKTLESKPDDKYLPNVGREIWGWQFSSKGKVPGILTNVDLNICYESPTCLEEEKESHHQYMIIISDLNELTAAAIQEELSSKGIISVVYEKFLD